MSAIKTKKRPGRARSPRPGSETAASLDESEMMTLRDVAEYLNCNYTTVFRLAHSGEIPAFRLGGSWRLSRSEIEKWIADQHVIKPEARRDRLRPKRGPRSRPGQ